MLCEICRLKNDAHSTFYYLHAENLKRTILYPPSQHPAHSASTNQQTYWTAKRYNTLYQWPVDVIHHRIAEHTNRL